MAKSEMAALLRSRDELALCVLDGAMQLHAGAVGAAAKEIGLAGASSLWRIAYDVPEVRAVLARNARKCGRQRKVMS